MNPSNWNLNPMANYAGLRYEQTNSVGRWFVPSYDDLFKGFINFHVAGPSDGNGYIKVLTEIARFENLNADTVDKTKICHDKICPSIWSRQFQFCPLLRIGPMLKL